jgi:ribosomal protein L27
MAARRQPQSCTQQRADRRGRHLRQQRLGGRADENGSILLRWKDTTWE